MQLFSLVFFEGVVEDIHDPLELGRVRVRIIGLHTANKTLIPTDTLPWAIIAQDPTSAATSGIGKSPTGILQGSTVIGYFRDGQSCQQPVITGTIAGIPEEKTPQNTGFSDPDGVYPLQAGENDVNRLARGITSGTCIEQRNNSLDKNVPTANGGTWSEPAPEYSTVYPNNKVFHSKSGHTIEVDDTDGKERVHVYHKSGSFVEFFPDGKTVQKSKKDNYEIVQNNKNLHVSGQLNITVDSNATVYVLQDAIVRINGNCQSTIFGDSTQTIQGNVSQTVQGNATQTVSGNMSMTVSGSMDMVTGAVTWKAPAVDFIKA
ncbi:MAG: hypothetical protein BV459_00535 [Thermoplasmata archaeon M11B2D]|nr:MAG: hypothetical protein BV459_00535 [Thermoplasmata archaeon M11B2D]